MKNRYTNRLGRFSLTLAVCSLALGAHAASFFDSGPLVKHASAQPSAVTFYKDTGASKPEGTATATVVEIIVEGKVTDNEGAVLPGVTVRLKDNKKVGTVTDIEGNYRLSVPDGQEEGTLVFSFVGYLKEEVPINNQTTIDVSLTEDIKSLEEVVVVGYGEQEKKTITGSISSIEGEELTKAPVATVSEALVGKVAGINTRMPDGRPGSAARMQIRNLGSPLYVIDGVPQGEPQFNNLNPEDIESISVLKDASAAIYGVRASNGVVLVTTKSGKRNEKNKVNIHTYYGWQSWTRFPQAASAADYVRASAEADVNQNGSTNWAQEEVERWQEGTEKGYRGFDWASYVQDNAPQQYLNVSTSGGSKNTSYYFSASHINQDAVFEGYNFNRTNLQSNVSTHIGERLKAGIRINGKIESRKLPGVIGGDKYWQPLWGLFRNLPTERPYANDNPDYVNNTTTLTTNNATFGLAGYTDEQWRSVQTNFDMEYDLPVKGLKAKGVYSFFFNNLLDDVYEYSFDAYTYNEATDTYEVTGGRDSRYRSRRNRHITNSVLRLLLNYDRDFGKHHVSAVFGGEAEERLDKNFNVVSAPTTNYIKLIREFNELQNVQDNIFESARAGVFFRTNYDYQDKYLLEVAARYDGSWRFPPGNRWGLFPSMSLGWRISEEAFLQNSGITKVLDDFKIRASYGEMGNDGVGVDPFAYLTGYNYGAGNAVLDGQLFTGIAPRGMPVRTLSWINSSIANVGIDFSLWNGKLSGTTDAFYRKRTGLPRSRYDVLIPWEAALNLPPENLAADAHMGIEGSLQHANTLGKLKYSIGANATFARERNLYSYKPRFGNSWNHYRTSNEDRWNRVQWGYNVIGRFQSEEEVANHPVDIDGKNNTTVLPGDFIYNDVNGDGVINGYDRRPVGYGAAQLPYLSFGFNSNFSFKGIDLSLNFAGGSMQSRGRVAELKVPFMGNANSPSYLFNDRWHREDIFDPGSPWVAGTYPALRRTQNRHTFWGSDFWFRNITYLRLRNIQLGYTLPKSIVGTVNIAKVRLYVNALNLFSFDNMKDIGVDPETQRPNGLDYPSHRVINVGANVTF
jgi:TonB-linked SusC/RagA family outer membrane protein